MLVRVREWAAKRKPVIDLKGQSIQVTEAQAREGQPPGGGEGQQRVRAAGSDQDRQEREREGPVTMRAGDRGPCSGVWPSSPGTALCTAFPWRTPNPEIRDSDPRMDPAGPFEKLQSYEQPWWLR